MDVGADATTRATAPARGAGCIPARGAQKLQSRDRKSPLLERSGHTRAVSSHGVRIHGMQHPRVPRTAQLAPEPEHQHHAQQRGSHPRDSTLQVFPAIHQETSGQGSPLDAPSILHKPASSSFCIFVVAALFQTPFPRFEVLFQAEPDRGPFPSPLQHPPPAAMGVPQLPVPRG